MKSINARLESLEHRADPPAFVRCPACDGVVATRDGDDGPLKCNGCGAPWPCQPDDTSIVVQYVTFNIGKPLAPEDRA